ADGTVGVVPAQDGLRYDDAASLRAIATAALSRDGAVALKPAITRPLVPTTAAQAAADDAKRLLRKPIALTYKGKRIGAVTPTELAPLVKLRRSGSSFALALAPVGLSHVLAADARHISRPAVDASWRT